MAFAFRGGIFLLVLAWVAPALGVVTEPEDLPALAWDKVGERVTRVSYGKYLVYKDDDGDFWARNSVDTESRPIKLRLMPYNQSLQASECIAAGALVYCSAIIGQSSYLVALDWIPPKTTPPTDIDVDLLFSSNVTSISGPVSLVGTRGDWILYQRGGSAFGEVGIWKPGVNVATVALPSGGYDRNPLFGNPGGYDPIADVEYVVYREQDESGDWFLKAWDISKNAVVSEIAVGGGSGPKLNDFFGYVYFEYNGEHWRWDPLEPSGGGSGEGSGSVPLPPEKINFDPSFHDCVKLSDLRVGKRFALIEGEGCGPSGQSQLFAITMWHNLFVMNGGRYQPFLVDVVQSGSGLLGLYAISPDGYFLVYGDYAPDLWKVRIDSWKVLPMHALEWPSDNDGFGVPLAPWNVGAYGYGEIDYAGSGRWQKWVLHLSDKQTYRISVVSDYDCGRWYTDTALSFHGDYVSFEVDDNETSDWTIPDACAAFEFTPSYRSDFTLLVFRRDWGVAGSAPPLPYTLLIEVL